MSKNPPLPALVEPSRSRAARTLDLLLGRDRRTRFQLTIWFTSVFTYGLYVALLVLQVHLGFVQGGAVVRQAALAVLSSTFFYVAIRSGWSKRVCPQEPGLGLHQLLVGIVFMWINYAVVGPVAGSTLIIMASQMVYAVFALSTRQVYRLAALSLLGLGMTMLIANQIDPVRYPADVQWVGYLYAALVVPLIARLAQVATRTREMLGERSRALSEALARVQELATRDELTRAYNRRHMAEILRQQQALHERSRLPLCIALLDIDLFKSVNDRFGHAAGDEVLRRFARTAADALRTTDLLARWGGEEFLVAFPNTPLDQADVALQRLRDALARADFEDVAPGLRISFSGGLTPLGSEEAVSAAIERADQAMYRAKSGGRNRVEHAAGRVGGPT